MAILGSCEWFRTATRITTVNNDNIMHTIQRGAPAAAESVDGFVQQNFGDDAVWQCFGGACDGGAEHTGLYALAR